MFASRFINNGSVDLKKVCSFENVIQGLHILLGDALDILVSWPRKWGSRGPTVIYASHKWLILIFSKTIEAINPQGNRSVPQEGIYNCIRNDVISYLQSAANCVHATLAVIDFTVTKSSFWNISESTKARICRI